MKKLLLIVALVVVVALVVPVARPTTVTAQEELDIPTVWYQTTLTGSSNLSGWDDTFVGTTSPEWTIVYKKVGDFVHWAGTTLIGYQFDHTDNGDPVYEWQGQVDSIDIFGRDAKVVSTRELRFTESDLEWTTEDDGYTGMRLELSMESDKYVLEGSRWLLSGHSVVKLWGPKGTKAGKIDCPQQDVTISKKWHQTILDVTEDRYDTDYNYLSTKSMEEPTLYRRVGDVIFLVADGIVKRYSFDPVMNVWSWRGHVDVVYGSGRPSKLRQYDKLRFTEDDLEWTEADDSYIGLRLELKRETTRYRMTGDGYWERATIYRENQWAPQGTEAETQAWYQTTLSGSRVKYRWDWSYESTAPKERLLVYRKVGDFLFTGGKYVHCGRMHYTGEGRSWRGCTGSISTSGTPSKMAQRIVLRFTESGGEVTLTLERHYDMYHLNPIEEGSPEYFWTESSHTIELNSGPEGTPAN